MIKPVIQAKKFKPDLGDVSPFPNSNILVSNPELNLEKNLISVAALGRSTPFSNLVKHNFDISLLNHTYDCPHTGLTFFSLAPLYIISDDISKYIPKTELNRYLFDNQWQWDGIYDVDEAPLPFFFGKISQAMIGTGYTFATLSSDGDSRLIEVGIELDNGDILVCLTWEWLNN